VHGALRMVSKLAAGRFMREAVALQFCQSWMKVVNSGCNIQMNRRRHCQAVPAAINDTRKRCGTIEVIDSLAD